jgi:hypothetical protein
MNERKKEGKKERKKETKASTTVLFETIGGLGLPGEEGREFGCG